MFFMQNSISWTLDSAADKLRLTQVFSSVHFQKSSEPSWCHFIVYTHTAAQKVRTLCLMLLANNLLQLQSIFGATFVRKHICALSSRVEYAGQCQTAYSVSTLVWRWMGWAKYEETRHIGSLTVFFTSQPTKPKVVVEEWEAIPQHCVTSTRSRCHAVVSVYGSSTCCCYDSYVFRVQ